MGISEKSLHNELGRDFADIARDPDNKIVLLTGTGANVVAAMDTETRPPETSRAAFWRRTYRQVSISWTVCSPYRCR